MTATRDGEAICDIRLLGPPVALAGGKAVVLPAKCLALISYLALSPGYAVRRNDAASLLWGDADPERSAGNLRQLLARLKHSRDEAAPEFLAVDANTIRLAPRARVDLIAFERARLAVLAGAADAKALTLMCDAYNGELLEGVADTGASFEAWLAAAREKLRGKFISAAIGAIEADHPALPARDRIAAANRLFEIEPSSEAAARVLLEDCKARGDRAQSRRIIARHEAALASDLGAAPEPRTAEIARQLGQPELKILAPEANGEASEPKTGNPRVVILPPAIIQAGDDTARLAAVLIEDVTVKLSRYRSITVLASHTATQLAAANLETISRTASYVVNTAVKPGSNGWSMTFRLTDARSGTVLWVSELAWQAATLSLIFDLLTGHIVSMLVDAIERSNLKFPVSAPGVSAYRLYLEGQQCLKSMDLPELRRARKWFREASQESAGYAAPITGLSHSLFMEWMVRGMRDPALLNESASLATQALALDPFDWRALRERGLCSLYLRRHEESLSHFEKAILLGPNDADLLADYADALAFSGEPAKGMEMCLKAMELNPIVPGYYSWILGSILFQQQRYGEALTALEPVKNNDATSRLMAACTARAGLLDEARAYAQKVREVFPGFEADHIRQITPNKRAEDMEHLIEGVRMAGLH